MLCVYFGGMACNIKSLFAAPVNTEQEINAWIRHKRQSSRVYFLSLSDGSTTQNAQAVGEVADIDASVLDAMVPGAAVRIKGLWVATPSARQPYELQLQSCTLLGSADPGSYPLQPKAHGLDFLRSIGHLRSRTATFGAVFRLRHALRRAIDRFFDAHDFFQVHTPILTATDAEGAGELFHVQDSEAFFGKAASLTVSGQLQGELLALGLSRVYTFGPCFRAENSNTTRHLSEFWMVEPEIAFCDLDDVIGWAKDLLAYVSQEVQGMEEVELLEQQRIKRNPEGLSLPDRIGLMQGLKVYTYTEALEELAQARDPFAHPITHWGQDLQVEHERYLVKRAGGPVVVRDYPAAIKAFYMRVNDQTTAPGPTVAAMDVLYPQVGELIGGSQREERLPVLLDRMEALKVPAEQLQWYIDTRRFGSVVHSGFGLGFERLVQYVSGMDNIRDVIPFYRAPGTINY